MEPSFKGVFKLDDRAETSLPEWFFFEQMVVKIGDRQVFPIEVVDGKIYILVASENVEASAAAQQAYRNYIAQRILE